VYSRHAADCPKRSDRFWRRCHCIKWIRGIVNDKPIRMSAGTRSWERAEAKAREIEQRGTRKSIRVSINEAVKAYLKDEQGRMLADNSTAQSRTLFERQFVPWTETEGFKYVDELTVPVLSNFRAALNQSTGNNANTARRKQQRLSGFFWFCIRSDWIEKNPARLLKAIKVKQTPTDYFTRPQFEKIVDATYAYGDWKGGHDFAHRQDRLRAFVFVMRWAGLAIRDTATLERQRLTPDGKLFLYRAKTGVPVYVPLPPEVVGLLRRIPNSNPRYFFWSGNGEADTAKKDWDRSLRLLFKTAAIKHEDGTPKRCHAHMFRDTFAVELLLAGVPMDQVSLLLGHSSTKITEQHYAPFVKARQEQLESSVRAAWGSSHPWTSPAELAKAATSGGSA
jgi:integrase/recombinase XerD